MLAHEKQKLCDLDYSGRSECFLCPLLTWNKNAQLEQEGGSAVLLAKLWGSQFQAQQSPPCPPPATPLPKAASSTVPEGQLAKRGSRRRSLDARVTELVFVLFKKQIPNRAKPPYPRGIGEVAAGGRREERE